MMFNYWGWRKSIVVILSCIVYVFVIHFIGSVASFYIPAHLRGYVYRLGRIGFLIACITLLAIEFQDISSRTRYLVFFISFLLSSVAIHAFAPETLHILLVVCILHIALLLLVLHKQHILHVYRNIHIHYLVQTGVRSFVGAITLCLCLMLAHGWKSVDINCTSLYTVFHKAGAMFSVPHRSEETTSLEEFSDATLADILGVDAVHIEEVLKQVGDINIDALLSGRTVDTGPDVALSLQTLKHFLTKELVEDKDIINEGFCSLIVGQIEKKQRSPLFLYSTAILLFFLLFPLLKLFFRIIDLITYLGIHICFKLGIYKQYKVMEEVEHIR